jgi:pyruvate/2-oxoglutarate dehydrogenase complex dihydrolipoamide dehydrogenase (E3) component
VVSAYPNEKKLGKNVVVIGGGEFGTETGMFLANAGHRVTAITTEKQLVEPKGPHQQEVMIEAYEQMENFDYITGAIATGISKGKVTYTDSGGSKKSIQADDVVIYAGLKPKMDEALGFSGSAKRLFVIGDCGDSGGTVQKSTRSAYFAAVQI